jgi:hypothetical protein
MLVVVWFTAIEVLTVNLEPIKIPLIKEAVEKHIGMFCSMRVDRREIIAIPPRYILWSPLIGE